MESDGRLVHAPPNGPPQQFNVSFQVVPEELWEVPGTDVYLDELHQTLHSALGNNTLSDEDCGRNILLSNKIYYIICSKMCIYSNFRVEVRVIQWEVILLAKMDIDPFSCVDFKMC